MTVKYAADAFTAASSSPFGRMGHAICRAKIQSRSVT